MPWTQVLAVEAADRRHLRPPPQPSPWSPRARCCGRRTSWRLQRTSQWAAMTAGPQCRPPAHQRCRTAAAAGPAGWVVPHVAAASPAAATRSAVPMASWAGPGSAAPALRAGQALRLMTMRMPGAGAAEGRPLAPARREGRRGAMPSPEALRRRQWATRRAGAPAPRGRPQPGCSSWGRPRAAATAAAALAPLPAGGAGGAAAG